MHILHLLGITGPPARNDGRGGVIDLYLIANHERYEIYFLTL